MKRNVTSFLVVLMLAASGLAGGPALAQSGKVSGEITDAQTGEPLPGATVQMIGTDYGTAADQNGHYDLIGLPPGQHDFRFQFVGYTAQVVTDVLVTSDRTTTLDIELSQEVVEGEELVVEAERPVVDPNQTTSRSLVTGEEMQQLPVTTLDDVISRTANSYQGFIRGSQRFESRTVLEGIDISDAYYSLSFGSNYEGSTYSSANRTDEISPRLFSLDPNAVAEVAVNSGATPAQYSTGSGGLVAVTLNEGRGPISGNLSVRIAPQVNRPGPDSLAFYHDADEYIQERQSLIDQGEVERAALYTWDPGKYAAGDDPEFDISGSLGGAVTDRWNFFLSGQWFQSHGYAPNDFDQRVSGLLKTSYQLTDKDRITAVGMLEDRGMWFGWNNRDYLEFWRFYLEGVAQNDGGSYLGSLKWTHIINDDSYFDVQAYRTFTQSRYGYPDDDGNGLTDPGEDGDFIDFFDPANIETYIGTGNTRDKMFYAMIADPFSDTGLFLPDGQRYKLTNPVVYSEDTQSIQNAIKVDYVNQITPNHFLQFGTEVKFRGFDYQEAYGVDGIGFTLNAEDEPFIPRGYSRNPMEFALYASDRMEYAGLIVNVGLRAEFVDRDMEEIEDYYFPFEQVTETINGRELLRNNFVRGDDVPMDVFLNPRIGISHPIGTTGAMYFSYARNEQLPPYSRLYHLYGGNHSRSRFFTLQHPNQDPITSNNFELGVQWEFAPGWGADVNAYMRAVDNYSTVTLDANNRVPEGQDALPGLSIYTYQTTFGYADVRGIELTIRRRPLLLSEDVTLGLTASYTFSSVERANVVGGINQRDFNSEGETDTQLPFELVENYRHFPQNVRGGNSVINEGYDRRHRGILRAVSSLPFNTSLAIMFSLESGFLYPPAVGGDPRERELLTGPTNYQLDLRAEKMFNISGSAGIGVFADIKNLTNHENVIAYETDSASGPVRFQETGVPSSVLIQSDGSPVYGQAFQVYIGSRLQF